MNIVLKTVVLCYLLCNCFNLFGQNEIKLLPFTESEIKQLRTSDGCGCYLSDANHCNDDYYLFADGELSKGEVSNKIPTLHLKINGQTTRFAYSATQYNLRITGNPEPVFDLHFDKIPEKLDIKNSILTYKDWGGKKIKYDKKKRTWHIGEHTVLHEDNINKYYLYSSESYVVRLYEYKQGVGMESRISKGEIFIYNKNDTWAKESIFYVLVCGC